MISEAMLRLAAEDYERALLAALPEEGENSHAFSRSFEKKMKKLCHRAKYESVYTFCKRAAIVAILCGSLLCMSNPQVRATVIEWIRESWSNLYRYSFVGNGHDVMPKIYGFSETPEGYVFWKKIERAAGEVLLYKDPDGNILSLSYQFDPEAGALYLNTDEHIFVQEKIGGQIMDFYLCEDSKNASTVVWFHKDQVCFTINAHGDKEKLIKLVQNVIEIK